MICNNRSWYDANEPVFQLLAKTAAGILENTLKQEAIEYPLIQRRVKKFESFLEKMEKKKYDRPEVMTDIIGIRAICFVPSDVQLISDIIERVFHVDWDKSVDKFKELKEDRVGYRGRNYVVTLQKQNFPNDIDYEIFRDIKLEIQVRTLLDYAWGEIEHDRSYKIAEELPKDSAIPRRFKIIAGTLELLDNEFDRLTKETQQYASPILSKIHKGDLNIPISPLSLREFLTLNYKDVPGFKPYFISVDNILDELDTMGIKTISDFNEIIPKDFKQKYEAVSKLKDRVTFSAIIRDILIIYDHKRYFDEAWKHHFDTLDYHCWKVYKEFNVNTKTFPYPDVEFDEGSDDD